MWYDSDGNKWLMLMTSDDHCERPKPGSLAGINQVLANEYLEESGIGSHVEVPWLGDVGPQWRMGDVCTMMHDF